MRLIMAFNQFKLDRSNSQSRGIFDSYIYSTSDTIAEVQATSYFIESRFAGRVPEKWVGSFITCKCADGVYEGEIDENGTAQPIATGAADGDVVGPASSTDTSIVLFSGATGKVIDEAPVTVDLDGKMTFTNLNNVKGSFVGVNVYEILSASDLDDLAVGGIITVNSVTVFLWNSIDTEIESNVRIVCENGGIFQVQSSAGRMVWIYTGTDTFISGDGAFTAINMTLESNSGSAKFIDLGTRALLLENAGVRGWNDLGEFFGGVVNLDSTRFIANSTTLSLRNCSSITIDKVSPIALAPGLNMITITNQFAKTQAVRILFATGAISSTSSIVRIDPAVLDGSRFLVTGCTVSGGGVFDTSGSDGTFTAVADATIATTTVTSVTDSGGLARFNYTGSSVYAGQIVELTGFTTSSYNTSGRVITTAGAGFFEFENVNYSVNDSGSFTSNSVTLTDIGTALVDGDTITVNTDSSTDYDGGSYVYNQQVDSFQINREFTVTASGTWSAAGLDGSDPRVIAVSNVGFEDSSYIGSGFVNDNSVQTTGIVNGVYQDIVFGTAGSSLIQATNTERFKLIDDVSGTWECTSNEEVNGEITSPITAVSSGGAREFLFKWVIDRRDGNGFVDMTNSAIAMNEIGSSAGNTSFAAPISMQKTWRMKPQVTRQDGSSDLTVRYAQIYIAGK
jgi:hypothetical protein